MSQPGWLVRHWRIGAVVLVIVATVGGWTWSVAQRGIAQIEAELRDTVELELWTTPSLDEAKSYESSTPARDDTVHPLTSTVQLLALSGETAIVQLITQSEAGQPDLRQTRFYRQTAEGWQRTKPDAELWGVPHSLESPHFIFRFRQNDAGVVKLAAPQIEEVYIELQRNFGLTPSVEKLAIDVTVEHVTGAIPIPQWKHEPLVVPSPAIYLAPVELSESTILAQSIVLPLIDHMKGRAIEEHEIPPGWRPLLPGLALWQLWELEMPLAHWHDDIVNSVYTGGPADAQLPDRYAELCAMHNLWMVSPIIVGVPLECRVSDDEVWVARRLVGHGTHMRLNHLGTWTKEYDESYFFDFTEVVAVATVFEYTAATYGYEALPVLLADLARYGSWETLAPAVFGVSAADFEAGWRGYLAQQYNVSIDQ
jgi:hypothetical protein